MTTPEEHLDVAAAPGDGGDDVVVRRLGLALKAARLYPDGHERVEKTRKGLAEACARRLAEGGAFLVEPPVRPPADHGTAPPLDPASALLGAEMRRRSIRAVRFEPTIRGEDLEALVTLLVEPPLELDARGGAVRTAETLRGITVVGYQYRIDRDPDARPAAPSSAWDLADLVAESPVVTTAVDGESIQEIPEVREELDRLRHSLEATTGPEESSRTVGSILSLVLDRVTGDLGEEEDEEDAASRTSLWDLASTAGERDREQIDEVADRIYGIVLTHLTLEPRPGETPWTPSADDPEVTPVDPRRLRRICTAVDRLPDSDRAPRLGDPRARQFAGTAFNLMPLCATQESWDKVLGRLARRLEAADPDGRRAILERGADLILAADLPRGRTAALLGTAREVAKVGEGARALLARLAHHPLARVRQLADRLDDESLGRVVDAMLEAEEAAKEPARELLRAASSRVLPRLREKSRHPDARQRMRVLEVTRILEHADVTRILLHLAEDPDEDVRLGALRALSERSDEDARFTFERTLHESSPELWQSLAGVLAKTGDLRVPRVLESIVRGEGGARRTPRDRLQALRILGQFPGPASRHRILGLTRFLSLREPITSLRLRREARRVLGRSPSTAPGSRS